MQCMIAAMLVCGSSVFTACSSFEDNPAPAKINYVEKMTGVWKNVETGSTISPNTKKATDRIVSTYIITPEGFGLYDELWMNGDKVVDKVYDRHINGQFSYHEVADGLLCSFELEDQGLLKYENGEIIDLFDENNPYIFTKCAPEEALKVRQSGLFGVWIKVYEETGKTPLNKLDYNKQIETYFFAPDGTGFFESIYFNGELLVEKEFDRAEAKFAYVWDNETDITCTDLRPGHETEQWKVTYDRGVFTDLEEANNPIVYSKVPFEVEQQILGIE